MWFLPSVESVPHGNDVGVVKLTDDLELPVLVAAVLEHLLDGDDLPGARLFGL